MDPFETFSCSLIDSANSMFDLTFFLRGSRGERVDFVSVYSTKLFNTMAFGDKLAKRKGRGGELMSPSKDLV